MLSGLFSSPWTQGSSASRTPIGRVGSRSWVSSAQNATSSISHLSQVAHSASRIAKRLRERDGTRSMSPLGPPPEIRVPISGTRAIPTGAHALRLEHDKASVARPTPPNGPYPSRPTPRGGPPDCTYVPQVRSPCPSICPHPPPLPSCAFPFA